MYIMSVKKRLQVLIVLGILVNENEMDSIWSTYHIKGIDTLTFYCQAQFQLTSLVTSRTEIALNLIITTPNHPHPWESR